jgi:hypothetical protein
MKEEHKQTICHNTDCKHWNRNPSKTEWKKHRTNPFAPFTSCCVLPNPKVKDGECFDYEEWEGE